MKKQLVFILAAIALIVVGIMIAAIALVKNRGAKTSKEMEKKSYPISEEFSNIRIDVTSAEIELLYAEDDEPRVETLESDQTSFEVKIKSGTLRIDEKQRRFLGIFSVPSLKQIALKGRHEVRVFLPKTTYASLDIDATAGDVRIEREFSFGELKIDATAGDVMIRSVAAETLDIDCTAGAIDIRDTSANSIKLDATAANISLDGVTANAKMTIETISGNIKLIKCDADELKLQTISGSINAVLLSEKVFEAKTTSGRISVPNNGKGGKCRAETVSGNIDIDIMKGADE